jgi:tRNA-specific 2-thiouridylase
MADSNTFTKKKIVVAMSGGVDSSVVACLLHSKGHEVIGITLQLYDYGEALKKKNACCAGVDIYDAKHVAEKFGFRHYVLNYQNNFLQSVIDDFADTYLQGETPIPCVKCNQSVKFADLLQVAKQLGADYMATGHYVQKIVVNNQAQLHKASDANKDQSYFLFATTYRQLEFLEFPLGGQSKEQTRQQAKDFGLNIANKPDSQDICFVPNGDYAAVIKKYRPNSFVAGEILHIATKQILGQHEGIVNFTIGQRRGLKIAYNQPLYVVALDIENNRVLVGEEEFLQKQHFIIRDTNWLINITENQILQDVEVRIRSNGNQYFATIKILPHNQATVSIISAVKAITPGQACVVYLQNQVLGGGWITKEIW